MIDFDFASKRRLMWAKTRTNLLAGMSLIHPTERVPFA